MVYWGLHGGVKLLGYVLYETVRRDRSESIGGDRFYDWSLNIVGFLILYDRWHVWFELLFRLVFFGLLLGLFIGLFSIRFDV